MSLDASPNGLDRICKVGVGGSIPLVSTMPDLFERTYFGVRERTHTPKTPLATGNYSK
jgi:hypothetical protein